MRSIDGSLYVVYRFSSTQTRRCDYKRSHFHIIKPFFSSLSIPISYLAMKRSSSTPALPNPVEGKWNYQDEILASSMMMVTIAEENTAARLRSKASVGNLSSASSGDTLSGWGSTGSRKSCKMDLSSMCESKAEQPSKSSSYEPVSMDVNESGGDSWGYFVDDSL
jgi:hypothetical protein